jgi:hypothetical protein
MKRIQLFEFLDQPWFPPVLRRAMTAYLKVMHRMLRIDRAWAPKLAQLFRETGEDRWVDLCSGAGGPVALIVPTVRASLGREPAVTLTDLYPQPGTRRVDATSVPDDLKGVRTIFAAFHHFPPPLARAILADAFRKRQPIAIFETTDNSLRTLIAVPLIPLMVLLFSPWIRPLTLSQFVLTYVIPIIPLLVTWDGFVSHLRTYSPEELRELVQDLRSPDYQWDIGAIERPFVYRGFPYLIGMPARAAVPGSD